MRLNTFDIQTITSHYQFIIHEPNIKLECLAVMRSSLVSVAAAAMLSLVSNVQAKYVFAHYMVFYMSSLTWYGRR